MSRSKDKRIRYAVIGAGNIAQVAVLPAFAHARENSELVGLVSGDPEKRAELRERFDIEFDADYDGLESVIDRGKIDAVYIATPNSTHRDLASRAAAKGVHVLCEKPLAPTADDCMSIIDACEKAGVKLMVAYRLHFEEATLAALDVARSGKLGKPQLFSSFFSHVVRPGDIRRDPEVAGGAVLDLGVYCINAARNLFEAEPTLVTADVVEKNGTDDTTTAILRFPGDRVAQFCVSNSVAGTSSYRIAGSDGDLRVEPAYEYTEPLVHYLTVDGDVKKKSFDKVDQFAPELLHFSKCILENKEPEPSGEEGWCDIRVAEAILKAARSRKPVTLEPYQRRRRPTLAQVENIRPVKKQEPVNAPSPSLK